MGWVISSREDYLWQHPDGSLAPAYEVGAPCLLFGGSSALLQGWQWQSLEQYLSQLCSFLGPSTARP